MRYSILMSLHDRNPVDLQKTLAQVTKAMSRRDKTDVELCVVFDFSPGDYPAVEEIAKLVIEALQETGYNATAEYYDTVKLHPETFHLDTHCNPVAVNNKLMDMAQGDNLVWLSSDMIIPPFLLDRMDKYIHSETGQLTTVWCARVIDQDSMAEFCGPSRPFPMMWCIGHPACDDRHDLELLKGFGFDDNDWVGRMAIKYNSVTIDGVCVCMHQTHGIVQREKDPVSGKAYQPAAKPGWEKSHEYIVRKWGGVPFDGNTLRVDIGEANEYICLFVHGLMHPDLAQIEIEREGVDE